MVNILTLALTHVLIALALLRMLSRKGLDPADDAALARKKRAQGRQSAENANERKGGGGSQ